MPQKQLKYFFVKNLSIIIFSLKIIHFLCQYVDHIITSYYIIILYTRKDISVHKIYIFLWRSFNFFYHRAFIIGKITTLMYTLLVIKNKKKDYSRNFVTHYFIKSNIILCINKIYIFNIPNAYLLQL